MSCYAAGSVCRPSESLRHSCFWSRSQVTGEAAQYPFSVPPSSCLPPFLPPLLPSLPSSPYYSSPETQLELEKNLSTAKEELSTASMKLRAMIRAFKESLIYRTPPSGTEHTGMKSYLDHCILQPHSQTIAHSRLIPRPLHTPVSFPDHYISQPHSQTFTYSFPYMHTHIHSPEVPEPVRRIEVWLDDAHWSLTQEDGQLQVADICLTNFR